MKKFLSMAIAMALVLSFGVTAMAADVSAAETSRASLTAEQQAVLNSYENNTITNAGEISIASSKLPLTRATAGAWRGSYYRGSALMWTKDWVEWASNGSSITSSTAWQEAGYIFPNIARATGISKHSTTSTSVTYRASKTIGAGVVTPWGDVSVYESAFTDFLKATTSGNLTVS
ncbi:MAG: hypothetical protein ACK5I7_06340 [Anaerotignum sp.]